MKFRTLIADPPWPYVQSSRHEKQKGYSNFEYEPLSIRDLADLPVADICEPGAVMLLWTTGPFLVSGEAAQVMKAWGFEPKSLMPWVKCTEIVPGLEPSFKPAYGVGYWVRGCAEYVLIGVRPGGKSQRSQFVGIMSERGRHSRKPDTLYEYAESMPGPYAELFARRPRDGWVTLGDEMDGDRRDIRITLPELALRADV